MNPEGLGRRLTELKCSCSWTKHTLPNGILACPLCDLVSLMPNGNGPQIRRAWPEGKINPNNGDSS